MKECREFLLGDRDVRLILYLLIVLLPAKQGGILEEGGGKWDPILTLSPGNRKMVLILLEEIIALQISFTLIYV